MRRFSIWRTVVSTLAVLVSVACGRESPQSALPGSLTKPVAQYSGDEFHEFVQGLKYTGGRERERKCTKDPACASAKRTLVRIDAISSEDSLGPTNTPRFGVVYARVTNRGDAEEARYGLAPGKQFEYFLIVSADTAGKMTWRLEQLDTTPNARRHLQVSTGPFLSCHHKWRPGARADFKSCDYDAQVGPDSNAMSAQLRSSLHAESQIWVACLDGCCSAAMADGSLR